MKTSTLSLFAALAFLAPAYSQDAETKPAEPATEEAKDDSSAVLAKTLELIQAGKVDEALKISEGTDNARLSDLRVSILQQRGEHRFMTGDIKGSIEDFDEVINIRPDRDPYHWQRGISYYYADRFQDGKEQFERHQTVNSQDVENAVWHFLCAVRAPGGSVESARENLIPITQDTRVPMKEVHALFSGKGTAEAVIAAAEKEGNPKKKPQARNAMMYAHLYLGIYYEAIGENDKMVEHITKSASTYRMEHYMGKVAQVHAKLRNIEFPE